MSENAHYQRDPTEVDFITSIPDEGASAVKRELRKSVYNHVRTPKKKPPNLTPSQFQSEQEDRIEQGVARGYDEAYEQLAVPDETAINDQLSKFHTILSTYDPVIGAQTCLLYIAPTVARKRLGEHETLWYGSFEVAKRDDGWEALCFSTLNPVDQYRTGDRHTTEEDDDVWLPTYGISDVWHIYQHPPDDALHLTRPAVTPSGESSAETASAAVAQEGASGSDRERDTTGAVDGADGAIECTRGHPDEADLYIHSPTPTEHGTRFILESPKKAAEAVKDIPTPPAYQTFDEKLVHWRFNAEALLLAVDTLTAAGWTVALSPTVETRHFDLYLTDPDIDRGQLPPLPDY